jgi:hypothetical protein
LLGLRPGILPMMRRMSCDAAAIAERSSVSMLKAWSSAPSESAWMA